MGYTYYRIALLIPSNHALSFEDLANALRTRFNKLRKPPTINAAGNNIQIKYDDWSLRIYWEENLDVLAEAQEIADRFAVNRSDKAVIASCNRRITTSGDPDPNMDHFNDFVHVIEVLESIEDTYIFDPGEGKIRRTDEPDDD